MSPSCGAFLLPLSLVSCFLQVFTQGSFLRLPPEAQSIFLRSKRANSFLVEEILQGNLERECYEELCNYEEAREYFEDTDRTIAFWTVYQDGDQCDPHPCLHGGKCTDKVGGFHCSCISPFYGPACELEEGDGPPPAELKKEDIPVCPTEGPTACHQFCTASFYSFTCSCSAGFQLHTDGRTCLPEVEFPCGRVPSLSTARSLGSFAPICHHGNCPWQVSVVDSAVMELCSGVLLGRRSVLTNARCLLMGSGNTFNHPSSFYVVAGDDTKVIPVQALHIHNRFRRDHHDNDLALLQLVQHVKFGPALIHLCLPTKDFAENILMDSQRMGLIGGRVNQERRNLLYITQDECRSRLNVSHPMSNKIFCMRRRKGSETSVDNQGLHRDNRRKPQTRGKRHYRVQRSQDGGIANQDQVQNLQNSSQEHQNETLHRHNRTQDRLNESVSLESQDRIQETDNRTQETPNNTDDRPGTQQPPNPLEPGDGLRSEVNRMQQCGGLLPGSPVATEEDGTVFLTGLLISCPADCCGGPSGGLVFSKVSRYLSWIKHRLTLTEDHVTSQGVQEPQHR